MAGPSNRPAGKSWLRGFVIISLILILPPALYFFVYVEQRVDTAGRHAYGVLAAVTSDLKSRIQAYEKIAKNAEKARDTKQFLSSLPGARIEARGEREDRPTVLPRLWLTPSAIGGLELHVRRLGKDVAIVPFKGLIPWYLVNSEFDGLLVFDGTNHQLIAQDRRLAEQSLGETVVLRRGDEQVALAEFVNPKGDRDAGPASILQRREWLVRVAGVEYRPFVQRLRVPVSGVESGSISGEIDVVLVALIQSERFWRDAVALSPRTFVRVGALLLLAVLVIPFLKLRFIGANERMRPFDIWLLAGSVPLASALLVLLVLNEYSVSLLRQRFDDSLRAFGATIEQHVKKEVASIENELGRETTVRTLFSDAASATKTQDAARGSILTQTPLDYPLLEALFLSGHHDGQQLAKMMPRTIPTGMVPVGSLPYYANGLSLQDRRFAFSPDVAITSGLRLGIFSVPVSLRRFGPEAPMSRFVGSGLPVQDRDGILAVATPMPSLNDAIVSAPFEFVVLERGLVVFQSARGPYLGERFYERVADGETLKYAAQLSDKYAAQASELEGPQVRSYDYRGRTYRMLPIRLKVLADSESQSPIDLIVYYEERNVGSLAAASFATGVALSFLVIVSLLLGAFLANVFFRSEALSWAWPSVRRNPLYASGILAGAAVALIMLGVVGYLTGTLVPWMLIAVPGLTMLAAGAASWWRSRSLVSIARCGSVPHVSLTAHRIHQGLFVGFGVVAILVLAALPAALAYDRGLGFFTSRFESVNAEKLQSEWLGRSPLKDQPIVKKSGAATPLDSAANRPCADTNADSGQPIADPRCVTTDRIYADETNYRTFQAMEKDLRRYDSCVDVREEGSCQCTSPKCVIDLKGASAAAVSADPRTWLAVFNSGSGALSGLMSKRSSTILWCGLLFAVLVTTALVRSVAKNVLGLHLTDRLAVEGPTMPTPGPNRSWLFLRPPMRVVRRLINAPGVRSLDLSDPALTAQQLAQDRSRDEVMLVIRNVEFRLKDETWRDALRDLIQNRGTRGIALTSEIDPYYFLAQQRREQPAVPPQTEKKPEGGQQDEVAVWAELLAGFEKFRYATRPMRWPKKEQGDEALRLLRARIRCECGSSERLQRIGLGLLRRRDIGTYTWEEILQIILDAAEPYYRSLWDLCSREERLVLIQLAQEGLLNPKKIGVVRRLARRRLVSLDPRFRIVNESFARFVREVEPPARVAEWERANGSLGWKQIATPLYLLAAVALALLLVTEQTLVTNILAIATGAAGALGSLRALTAQFRPSTPPAKAA